MKLTLSWSSVYNSFVRAGGMCLVKKIDRRIIVLKAESIWSHPNLLLMFGGSPLKNRKY
jgi:hypothetical protein